MKQYRIKPEFWSAWGNEVDENSIVDENEVKRLSYEWGIPVDDLMEQLDEVDIDPAAQEIIDNGNYDSAVALMDDEIREAVHADLAPCSDTEFLTEYMKRHAEKYGEEFCV